MPLGPQYPETCKTIGIDSLAALIICISVLLLTCRRRWRKSLSRPACIYMRLLCQMHPITASTGLARLLGLRCITCNMLADGNLDCDSLTTPGEGANQHCSCGWGGVPKRLSLGASRHGLAPCSWPRSVRALAQAKNLVEDHCGNRNNNPVYVLLDVRALSGCLVGSRRGRMKRYLN